MVLSSVKYNMKVKIGAFETKIKNSTFHNKIMEIRHFSSDSLGSRIHNKQLDCFSYSMILTLEEPGPRVCLDPLALMPM